ncbi:MAG: hypothetical protein ACO3WM_03070, partial [Gemmobacter sp.]
IPDFPKPGIVFKDITPLLADRSALALAVECMAHPWRAAGGSDARSYPVFCWLHPSLPNPVAKGKALTGASSEEREGRIP